MEGITTTDKRLLQDLKSKKRPDFGPQISNSEKKEEIELTGGFPLRNENYFDKEMRKEQILLGRNIFEFQRAILAKKDETVLDLTKKRGRPPKDVPGSLNFSVCLTKMEVETLDGIKTDSKKKRPGRGTKVNYLLNYYIENEKLQKQQMSIVKELINNVSKLCKEFVKHFDRSEKFEELEKIRKDMLGKINNLQVVLGILKFDNQILKKHLNQDQFNEYMFALNIASNRKIGNE